MGRWAFGSWDVIYHDEYLRGAIRHGRLFGLEDVTVRAHGDNAMHLVGASSDRSASVSYMGTTGRQYWPMVERPPIHAVAICIGAHAAVHRLDANHGQVSQPLDGQHCVLVTGRARPCSKRLFGDALSQ